MRTEILGVGFDALTMDRAVSRALSMIGEHHSARVCTPNPEIIWDCRSNPGLRSAIAGADMVLADGIGVVYGSRILGTPLPERVSGYDFICSLFSAMEGTVFLLGAKPGVAEEAAARMEAQWPSVRVVGTHDGYFSDERPVVDAVRKADPDVLLVCLGSPKQELFMQRYASELSCGLMAGLGGCLDVFAGRVQRAPRIWIRLHLEWLYRLIKQPSRLRRQLCLPKYLFAVIKERFSR